MTENLKRNENVELTGYPHIDKPWLKYYSKEAKKLEILRKTIYENLCNVARKRSNNAAIDYMGKIITYKELQQRIDVVANAFVKKGVKNNDIVSLLTANIPENVIAIYALNKIGAICNMVDLTLKGEELASKINEAGSKMVIATDVYLDSLKEIIDDTHVTDVIVSSPFDSLPFIKKIITLKNRAKIKLEDKYILWKDFEKSGQDGYEVISTKSYEENKPVAILYTSGTTGKSKGAMLTNECFTSLAQEYKNCGLEFEKGDRFFNEEPPFISYCVNLGINLPLSLGMCIVMFPDYQPENYAKRTNGAKAHHFLGCPADYENFDIDKNIRKYNFSQAKTFASGGVGFDIKKKEYFNKVLGSLGYKKTIFEGYGMTEFGSAACTNLPQYDVYGTVGLPLPMTNVCIYDNETESFLKYGEQGEICFSGPKIMKGYLGNKNATDDAIKKHSDGKLWLHTGDLGIALEDGGIKIAGRSKRLITRYDGFNISPFEIEDAITESELVESCCVVNSPDRKHGYGNVPAAYVVLKDKNVADEALEDIKRICNLRIIERNLPEKYVLVEELPLTKLRKTDFKLLEEIEEEIPNQETDKTWVYRKIRESE